MKKSFTISLSTPCSEKWENFAPTDRGAFCSSCSKEVIDFTSLSDQQLIEYFKSKPKNSCGRFRPEQLTSYRFQNDSINPGWRLWRAGMVAITLAVLSKPSMAQVNQGKPKTEQQENSATEQVSKKMKSFTVTGIIYDMESSPLPGVNVTRVGTDNSTATDAEGKFQLAGIKEGDLLFVSFIGLKSQEKVVAGPEIIIYMENDVIQLGGYLVGGATATNKISFRRWWWRLKGLF